MEGEQDKRTKNRRLSGFNKNQIPGKEFLFCFLVLEIFWKRARQGRFTAFKWIHLLHIQVKIPRRNSDMGLVPTGKFRAGDMNLGITATQIIDMKVALHMYYLTDNRMKVETRVVTKSEAVPERSNRG